MAKKYTTTEVVELFKKKHGERYDYSKFIYHGKKNDKSIVVCRTHGEFLTSRQHHLNGSGCPECAGVPRGGYKRKTTDQFLTELSNNYPKFGLYDFTKFVYKNNTTDGVVICPEHGEFRLTPKELLYKKQGCPECSGKKRLSIDKIRTLTDYTILDQEYTNNKTPIKVICSTHGEWEVRPDNLIHSKTKCPSCAGQLSNIEGELREFVINELCEDVVLNDRKILGDKRELDLLSLKYNIAIEMNGLFHHSEEQGKNKHYHISKTNICRSKGIRLFHIFEDEWLKKNEIWKSILRYNFRKTPNKIYARKCVLRTVDKSATIDFLNNNHLQGYSNSSVSLGLYHDDKLVSIMTFGRSRFDKNIEWELIRYANILNTSVVGGFQKLFKYFLETYDPKTIVSYADKRYSEGNVYRVAGMKETNNDSINYYYFNKREGVRYSRHQFQKHKLSAKLSLFDASISEVANMRNSGFNRIYDCGNYKFVWYKKIQRLFGTSGFEKLT